LFDARLPPDKVVSVLEHVAEGCSVRQTERLCRVAPNTVARYNRLAGAHAAAAHDDLVAISPWTIEVMFDEKWAIVAKAEARRDRSDPAYGRRGDYWNQLAFDPEHRLVVSVVPRARTVENAETVVDDFQRRKAGRAIDLITCDEYPAYEGAILRPYDRTVAPSRRGGGAGPRSPAPSPARA
jgi:hypothetical protein